MKKRAKRHWQRLKALRKNMNKIKIALFISFCLLGFHLKAEPYTKSPFITDSVWKQVEPYLLPEEHPLKPKLDALFLEALASGVHPLADPHSLHKAGFKFKLRDQKFMIVASHPDLKGHLVKVYLDEHSFKEGEWSLWIRRILGAKRIQASIEAHGYEYLLKVPKKWIYALPEKTIAPPSPNRFPRHFILVVENMQVVSHGKNIAKYRFMMNEELLEALFIVLHENQLFDSMYLDNIPFSKDHKVAFIDTEHYGAAKKPMPYDQMLPRLSPKMQLFWRQLVSKYRRP